MNPEISTLDLGTIAKHGLTDTTPCAGCGKQTRSHFIANSGKGWEEIDRENQLNGLPAGTEVRFTVVCHGCFTDMDDEWEPRTDAESTFRGTIG